MLDKILVKKKLANLGKYLNELEPILKLSYEEFVKNYREIRTAERDFQLIVDAAVDINVHLLLNSGQQPPEKNYESFIALEKTGVLSETQAKGIAPSAGLRNRLVHEYDEINPEILHRSLKKFVKSYKEYGMLILRYLDGK
ncbi:MAG: DUF86 domain-containing protein [Patescibacteria group bacterium]|nr:DUF86 domain-containing protein [Patescibacteria group bacterium]